MNFLQNIYKKAKEFSRDAHESIGQKRKVSGGKYYLHTWAVAELVYTKTKDEEILAAACLHDVIEDVFPKNPIYNAGLIQQEFGERVLGLVLELTDEYTKTNYPDLSRKERKRLEAIRISQISEDAKLIKRADLHHNSLEIGVDEFFNKTWLAEKENIEKFIGKWQ